MKKIFLMTTFILSHCFAFSQFGIKAGANFSNITTDDDNIESLEAKVGFQAGVMLKLNLTEKFAIQPEALFVRKGVRYEFLGADVKSNMDYLDLPILLVLEPFDLPIQIMAGSQFSYLLGTNVRYENAFFSSSTTYEVDRENFEDYDIGYAVGLGISLGNSILDLRFTQGLKKYEKETQVGNVTFQPASRHFNLQASLGVFF